MMTLEHLANGFRTSLSTKETLEQGDRSLSIACLVRCPCPVVHSAHGWDIEALHLHKSGQEGLLPPACGDVHAFELPSVFHGIPLIRGANLLSKEISFYLAAVLAF